MFRLDRKGKAGGGGVCIHIYRYIQYSLSVRLLSITPMDLEMVWKGLKLGKKEFMIGCLYRPPNSSVKFWSSLEDLGKLEWIRSNRRLAELLSGCVQRGKPVLRCPAGRAHAKYLARR